MIVNFNDIDLTNFYKKEGLFCGQNATLITPKIDATWTLANLIFRSSIWDKNGELLSGGFKKFTNWLEAPELDPAPPNLDNCSVISKIDGSLGIFDFYNDRLNVRTRGTFNAEEELDNRADFSLVKKKYPQIAQFLSQYRSLSLLVEVVTPNQKIIIDYGPEVDIYLLGIVFKPDYSYYKQEEVDNIARTLGLKRPQRYFFNSIKECQETAEALVGQEGYCVYYNNDQSIRKLKSTKYLLLHKLKSEVSNINKVIDLWFERGQPGYEELYNYLAQTFDWEIAEYSKGHINNIIKANCMATDHFYFLEDFASKIKHLTRKEQAAIIIPQFPKNAALVFNILDGKGFTDAARRKLMETYLS